MAKKKQNPQDTAESPRPDSDSTGAVSDQEEIETSSEKPKMSRAKIMEQMVTFGVGVTVLLHGNSDQDAQDFLRIGFPGVQGGGCVTPKWQEWTPGLVDGRNLLGQDQENEAQKVKEGEQEDPVGLTWTTSFEVNVDHAWASAVNRDANAIFTIAGEDKPWKGAFAVDISSFLNGETLIEYVRGPYPGYEDGIAAFPNCHVKAIKVKIQASQVPLTEALCEKVNPLTVTLLGARPLPGLIVETGNAKLAPYVTDPVTKKKDVFRLQKKYCEPVYARFNVFPGLFANDRVVRSAQFAQGSPKVRFNCSTTILIGDADPICAAEFLEKSPLVVNLHDRDVLLCTAEKLKALHGEKFREQYAKAVDSEKAEQEQKEAAQATTKKSQKGKEVEPDEDEDETKSDQELEEETPKLTVFDVDSQVWREYEKILEEASSQQAKGRATFPLDELWSSSRELIQRHKNDLHGPLSDGGRFGYDSRAVEVKVRGTVVPMKRSIPVGGEVEKAELDISDEERMVRQPGRFLEAGTEIRLYAAITHPLHEHPSSLQAQEKKAENLDIKKRTPKFERMVFLFQYENGALMQNIRAALQDVNGGSLPHAESLRSYQLTAEEREAANNGDLDILTGFQVLDDEFRVVVLEGLGDGGISRVRELIPRLAANNEQCRILSNSKVRYVDRLYTEFDVDLKIIRLRDPLCYIMQAPEIYDSFKVDNDCRSALLLLSEIRSMVRSKPLFRNESFPTPKMLVKLESKYGESVSIQDIEGKPKTPKQQSTRERRSKNQQSSDSLLDGGNRLDSLSSSSKNKHNKKKQHHRRKAATDSANPAFDEARKNRSEKDYLQEHREIRGEMRKMLKSRMEQRTEMDKELLDSFGLKSIYKYSGQKLNFVEMQTDRMRKRLAKHQNVTYTYSKELQSLTFPLINEAEISRIEARRNRSKFITQRGFVYPAARTAVEDRKHKRHVSEARAEELRQPWTDPAESERAFKKFGENDRPNFDCIPTNDYLLFGGYNRDGTRNPEFFRSVHIGGDGVEMEMVEKTKREKQEWLSKVIVDNVSFNPHRGLRAEKPTQLDKLRDILQTKPRKKGIRIVRNAKLPSGKKIPLRPPPVSIFGNQGEDVE